MRNQQDFVRVLKAAKHMRDSAAAQVEALLDYLPPLCDCVAGLWGLSSLTGGRGS